MTLASQKKKASEKELKALLDKVLKLETQHKRAAAIKLADDLLTLCKELQAKLNLQVKWIIFFRQVFFYEHVYKSGKFLARALRDICSTTTIT